MCSFVSKLLGLNPKAPKAPTYEVPASTLVPSSASETPTGVQMGALDGKKKKGKKDLLIGKSSGSNGSTGLSI